MLISIAVAVAATVPLYYGYKKLKRKPPVKLKNGDIVILKRGFSRKYPNLPKSHPMHIEKIEGDFAIVLYMEVNRICHEKVLKTALSKAS